MTTIPRLSDEEVTYKFGVFYIANPKSWAEHPTIIPAVICPLGPGDRIIRTNTYQHQWFGKMLQEEMGEPEWHSVGPDWPDLARAYGAATTLHGDRKKGIFPEPSFLKLMCHGCQVKFKFQADYLPLNATVKCPVCEVTGTPDRFYGVYPY